MGSGVPGARRREDGRAARASIGARTSSRSLRIKHLLLVEGLTLAGARRRLEEESAPVAADAPVIDELIGQNARERLTEVKRGLRSILELLSGHGRRERVAALTAACQRAGCAAIRGARPSRRAVRRRAAADDVGEAEADRDEADVSGVGTTLIA